MTKEESIRAWLKGLSPTNRNLLLTGIAGLFTGGIAGAIVSPIAFHQYHKRINQSVVKWLAWAGTGLIAAPILLGAQVAVFGGGSETAINNSNSEVAQNTVTVEPTIETQTPEPSPPLPSPSPSPTKPLSEAEQFKQVVLLNTNGTFASERVNNMNPDELFAYQGKLTNLIQESRNTGVSLEYIKQAFAEEFHIQHGMDETLSYNLSSGLIEGTLAWERGERPATP